MSTFDPFSDGSSVEEPFDPFSSGLAIEVQPKSDPLTFERLFSGIDSLDTALPAEASSSLNSAVSGETNPGAAKMRAVNTAYLAHAYQKPAEEIAKTYEQFRDAYASDPQGLGASGKLDDAGFYTRTGQYLQRRKAEASMLQEIQGGLFESLRRGYSFETAFESERKARWTTPGWIAAHQDVYRQQAREAWDELNAKRTQLEHPIDVVSSYLNFVKTSPNAGREEIEAHAQETVRLRNAALDTLAELPDREARLALGLASAQAAKAKPEHSFGGKLTGRVFRGAENLSLSITNLADDLGRRIFDSKADADRGRRRDMLDRALSQTVSGEVDPLKGTGWLSEGILAAAESTPRVLTSFTVPGIVANFAANTEELRSDYASKGISPTNASVLASIAAVPYTALQVLSARMLFDGEFPGLSKFLSTPAKSIPDLALRTIATGGAELTEQFIQSNLQKLAPPTVQAIASHLSTQIPSVDWSKELEMLKDSAPETIATLLPLIAVGTTRAVFRDRSFGLEYLKREGYLHALGLPEDAIADVMTAPSPEVAGNLIRDAWEKRASSSAQKESLQQLSLDAIEARDDHGAGLSADGRALLSKYPDIFSSIPYGQIPVEIRTANAETTPVVFNGYWDLPSGLRPCIGYKTESGWSHGVLRTGEELVTKVPSNEAWLAGIRNVDEPLARVRVRRLEGGTYEVTGEGGETIGTAASAEGAARIIREKNQQSRPVDLSTPAAAMNARAEATTGLASGKLEEATAAESEPLQSVFQAGRPNRATIFTAPSPNVEGSISAPQVIDALAKVLAAGGQNARSLRFGRLGRLAKKAAGFYRPRDRIIRVQTSNNIETAAHEVAHGIEDAIWGIGHVWEKATDTPEAARTELLALGHDLYGDRKPQGGYASEGFAEFMRLYVTDPKQAQERAPKFYENWETKILSAHSELESAVKAAQKAGTTFYEQGSIERARQGIAAQPSPLEELSARADEQLTSARRKWIESAQPIADFVEAAKEAGAVIKEDANPYANLVARRLTADAVTSYMATEGMLDFAGNVVGKPLQDAFALVKGRAEDFVYYLWAKRALALWNDPRGPRNPGLAKVDAEFIAKEFDSPAFAQAAQHVYDWNNGVLQYAAQASPDYARAVSKIREADPGFYIPLFREFQALDDRYTGRGSAQGKSLVAHLKGSGRRIKDPIESMVGQAKAIVLKAHQKAILDQIIRIAETTKGLGHLVTEVPQDQIASSAPQWQVVKSVVDAIEAKAGPEAAETIGKALNGLLDGEAFTFFMPAVSPKQNEAPILPVFRNGKVHWYEMDPELYKALSGMDHYRLPRALDLFLGMPARTFRLGTTGLRAAFSLVTNPIRDLRTLHMNSASSANSAQLFGYWMGSLRDLATHTITFGKVSNEWSDLAKRLGVEMAGSVTQDSRPLQAAVRKLKRGGDWSPLDVQDNFDLLRSFLQFPETATRLAEMKAVAKDLGWDPSQPLTPTIAAKLTTAGKQVTTDFTQSGELARVFNQAIPFFNASIQGPVSHLRALERDPMKFVIRGLQGSALALALWYQNKDRDWWREMSAKDRYLFSYFEHNGELIRIPRSYEADGLFMAMTEALADAWHREDPKVAAQWFGQELQQLTQIDMVNGVPVPPLPVLPKLMAQQLANRDFFFDRPIVPRGEIDNVRPADQYNEFSSTIAINLGQILNVSPRRIDFTIRNVFGGVGSDVIGMFGTGDNQTQIPREREMADLPAVGVLFQRGGAVAHNPESIDKLYDAYEHALHIQHSKRQNETAPEKEVRLMLSDAVRTQTALTLIERELESREKRQQVQALRLAVAKTAVQMAQSGEVDRTPNRRILAEAKRELAALQGENHRSPLNAK